MKSEPNQMRNEVRMNYLKGPIKFGVIMLNGFQVIVFTRQVSAADADWCVNHSSPSRFAIFMYKLRARKRSLNSVLTTAIIHQTSHTNCTNGTNFIFSPLDEVRKDLCHHYASAVRRVLG